MDSEYLDQRPRYWLTAAGFYLLAGSFILLGATNGLYVYGVLSDNRELLGLLRRPIWTYAVGLPLSYGAVIGAYLLWGRWTDSLWQRRVGLLILLNFIDAVVGTVFRAEHLGLEPLPEKYEWMLGGVTSTFGWVEFALSASLAAEVASHLGRPAAAEPGLAISRLAMIGLCVWVAAFLALSDWRLGFPLQERPVSLQAALFRLGLLVLNVLCCFQVATLCLIAGTQSRHTWKQIGAWGSDPASLSSNSWGERGD